jgi:hypothetical protein
VPTKSKVFVAAGLAAFVCAATAAAGPVPQVAPTQTTGYPWVQLPAWVGTGVAPPPAAVPSVSYPWVQPPAWVPIT